MAREKAKAKAAGKSEADSEKKASTVAYHKPQFKAVKAWQDVEAEIKVKRALEDMMEGRKIPTLIYYNTFSQTEEHFCPEKLWLEDP